MGGVKKSRSEHPNLLTRCPLSERTLANRSDVAVVDQAEQVRELADLLERGLLSREEFQRQRSKVFGL
jgi:Short C-terminal domain